MTFTQITEAVVKGLPPGFLALCVLNVVFLAVFGWFVLRVAEARNARDAQTWEFLTQLLTTCVKQQETK